MSKLQVTVYNQSWEKVGEHSLGERVFGVEPKEQVLHEAVLAQEAGARQAIAHTKTRGEVRGGGKKPWRQKGTGRARHGSSRSPIWVGGGITFGPRSNRAFAVKINRKTRALAIRMSLSDKVADGKLLILDALQFPEKSTKNMAVLLSKMPVKAKKMLLVLPARDEAVALSARNIDGIMTTNASSLSVKDIIAAGVIVTTVGGVVKMESIFGKKVTK